MPQLTTCPQCNSQLNVPDSLLGKKVKCPRCSTVFQVGGSSSSGYTAPAPAPPPWDQGPEEPPLRRPSPAPPPAQEDYEEQPEEQEAVPRPRRRRRSGGGYQRPNRSGTILTLGILSIPLACCPIVGLILGVIALSMASADTTEIRAGRMDPTGEGSITAGRICGIIGLVLAILNMIGGVIIQVAQLGK